MATQHHQQVDLRKWTAIFPIETFEKKEGPRQFSTTAPGDPLDLWKAEGTGITSPADLCEIELVRRRVGKKHDLGKPVPVDVFLWSVSPPQEPYLTKLGGVPHREAAAPWPTASNGDPYTFVAQFCFLDSKAIVSKRLPGDVMLIFFKNARSHAGAPEDVQLEWAPQRLVHPLERKDCPKPRFPVPELSGVIYRCNEYPESWDAFKREGHRHMNLFTKTESTKIGRVTGFIQGNPAHDGEELFCALNSLTPNNEWPFVDLDHLPEDQGSSARGASGNAESCGWEKYRMVFDDCGCMYFLIDERGAVRWHADCN